MYNTLVDECVSELLSSYKCCGFTTKLRTFILGLPRRKLNEALRIVDSHLSDDKIPGRIVVLVRDLVRFRTPPSSSKNRDEQTANRKFLKVYSIVKA